MALQGALTGVLGETPAQATSRGALDLPRLRQVRPMTLDRDQAQPAEDITSGERVVTRKGRAGVVLITSPAKW